MSEARSESRLAVASLASRAVPAFLNTVLRPPPRFAEPDETGFLSDTDRRSANARQTGLVLLLLIWMSYFGWDYYHALQNEEFRPALDKLLVLRLAGTACIVLTGAALLLWPNSRRTIAVALSSCLVALYLLSLTMIAVTVFPYNYLFYYICLPLILLFMFGAFRLESRLVYLLAGLCLFASFVFLLFAETTEAASPKSLLDFLSKSLSYYNVAASVFLISFSIIGCAVAVELERTAREAFARERLLSDRNARLAASERDTRTKTAALVKAKDELRALAERQNHAKSRFLADAAHDLRQPMQALTSLLGAARQALAAGDPARCDELLDMAEDASRLTRNSFNAVLDISRFESGFVEAEYVNFDLPTLIEEVAAPFRLTAGERGIDLRLCWNRKRRILVRSDRHLLGRVIANLLSNAIKYRDPAKGTRSGVLVGIVCLPNRVRIDVVDNGVGICETDWPRVFNPFVQLGNAERDRDKGVGLGLSIVAAVVDLLAEHRLDMQSRVGEGTRFSLELPHGDPAPTAQWRMDQTRPPGPVDLSGLYAFYVEDDPLVRESTAALLGTLGMRYELFGSLAELEAALPDVEREPDLVISDYRLPHGRTAEHVAGLIARAFDPVPPMLVLTGEMLPFEEGPWLGAGRILRKPVSPEALVAAISAACVQAAAESAAEPAGPGGPPRSEAPSAGPL